MPAIDTLVGSKDITASSQSASKATVDPFQDDSDSDNIFNSASKSLPAISEKVAKPPNIADDPLLSSSAAKTNTSKLETTQPASTQSKSKPTIDPFADDSEGDDFFSVSRSKPSARPTVNGQTDETKSSVERSSPVQSSPPVVRKPPSLRESPPPVVKEPPSLRDSPPPVVEEPPPLSESPPPLGGKSADAFALDDSDDDLFSTKPRKKTKQKPMADIFDDDELFASSKPAKKKSVLVSHMIFFVRGQTVGI